MFERPTFQCEFWARRLLATLAVLFTAAAWPTDPSSALIEQFDLTVASQPSRDLKGYRSPKRIIVMGGNRKAAERIASLAPDADVEYKGWVLKPNENFDDVDVLIGPCNAKTLDKVPNVRWLHGLAAGVDNCADHEAVRSGRVTVTNSARILGPEVADHAIALTLGLTRGIAQYVRNQGERKWQPRGPTLIELRGKTLLIAGLGGIGTEIARRAKGFGMHVTATRNSSREGPDFVDYVGLSEELIGLSKKADVVINVLPLTPKTQALFDASFFRGMKRSAYFVNVGRGESVVTKDLERALKRGHIAGAGLDVVDQEPLPENSSLWRAPNLIVTPHQGGSSQGGNTRRWAIVEENVRRYVAGDPLVSVINPEVGY